MYKKFIYTSYEQSPIFFYASIFFFQHKKTDKNLYDVKKLFNLEEFVKTLYLLHYKSHMKIERAKRYFFEILRAIYLRN